MIKNLAVVPRVIFGRGCLDRLGALLDDKRSADAKTMVFLIDDGLKQKPWLSRLPIGESDRRFWVNVDEEPKTSGVDALTAEVRAAVPGGPAGVVGVGGGSVMDIAKAVALMLTNEGSSADYQGWDLIRHPATYHVGVPTLSGTGAEVSRTTVLTGPVRKLGMNSDHTVFDQIVLDPDLVDDAPDPQRFFTGMDCYIHCVESLEGTFRNAFSTAYAEKAMELCREVFLGDAGDDQNDKLMMASYFGGLSIAYSQVGVCHAMSYGLSYVCGVHHGVGNCIVFDQLEDYYAEGVAEFRWMMDKNFIELPQKVTAGLSDGEVQKMVDVALSLDPLWENALGPDWKSKATPERLRELYARM